MEWAEWEPTWLQIRTDFGFSAAEDLDAARILHAMVPASSRFRALGIQLRNRSDIVVVGCGPSLEKAPAALFGDQTVVAADGAVERLRELGILPQVLVTDLDGEPEALKWAADAGSIPVVHAHGDNREELRSLAPSLGPLLHGTHQVGPENPLEPLRNLGGFTDGDRAVVMCEALGARSVRLVGFDFDAGPSRYSHRWDPATKPRKLRWAERIIRDVHARGRTRVEQWVP